MPIVLEDVDELDDVWVIHSLQYLNLLTQRCQVGIVHFALGKNLDGDFLLRDSVLGLLNGGKTATADCALDLVELLDVLFVRCWI